MPEEPSTPSPAEAQTISSAALLTTQEAAVYLGIADSHVRALVSDRRKKEKKGQAVTAADGLPPPQEHQGRRLHRREDLDAFKAAREAQKTQVVSITPSRAQIAEAGAQPSPALSALHLQLEARWLEIQAQRDADLRALIEDGRRKDRLLEEKDAENRELRNRLEEAQKRRRWWFWKR